MPRDMPEQSAKRNRRRRRTQQSLNGSRYCGDCNKEFSRPTELTRHLTETLAHNDQARKYKCQYCGSGHTQKSNLKVHERIHLNEQKEICNLPLNETQNRLCDFKCSDPSSMTRHIYNVHALPYYDISRDQMDLPVWLARAMEERTETKGCREEPALAHTPHLSSSPRSSSPRSSTESGICTPSPLSAEPLAGQNKTSYVHNNFVPRTNIDISGGSQSLPDFITLLPSVHQPVPHHVSAPPDITFADQLYLAAPAPTFSINHAEGPSTPTSSTLIQSTGGSSYFYTTQDYNSGFSIPYVAPFRNQIDERSVTQGVGYFDLPRLEAFSQFSTNYLV